MAGKQGSGKNSSHSKKLGTQIINIFKMISERTDLKKSDYAKASFQEFILRLLVAQHKEEVELKQMDNGVRPRSIPYEKIDIDYSVIFNAIKTAFEGKRNETDRDITHYSMD